MSRFVRSLLLLVTLALVGASVFPAIGQTTTSVANPSGPPLLACSPTPCVLPAIQVSQGPNDNWDAVIAADPSNPQNVIVGTNDANCTPEGAATQGFLLSSDGGSDWSQYCMPGRSAGGQAYTPGGFPVLGGYDRNGVAYIGGYYYNTLGAGNGEGFQKSSDGVHWTAPAPAILSYKYEPIYCWMAVDASASSPYVNSVCVSCDMLGFRREEYYSQLVVAHSRDGANYFLAAWMQLNTGRDTQINVGGIRVK